jgi:hypothetical protein
MLEQIGQALVRWEWGNHLGMVAAKARVQNQFSVIGGNLAQVFVSQHAQQWVSQLSCFKLIDVVLQLVKQDRHKIHDGTNIWMLFQVIGHVRVILDRMQVGPWQQEITAFIVAVIRLMHMPKKDYFDGFSHWSGAAVSSRRKRDLADAAYALPEHLGRNERHAVRADVEPFAICLWIDANFQSIRYFAILVDDHALQDDVSTDVDIW